MAVGAAVGFDALETFDNARNSLTDPTATGILPQARRAICDAAASSPGQIASIYSPGVTGLQKFCEPYYEDNGDQPPGMEAPFQGGQCPGVRYEVRSQRAVSGGGTTFGSPLVEVTGPITSITYSPNPAVIGENGSAVPVTLTVVGATTVVASSSASAPPGQSVTFTPVVSRVSGGADTCGDPPSIPTPSPDYSRPRPVGSPTTINVNGDDVDVTVSPEFTDLSNRPYVNVDIGGITIPISLDNPGAQPDLPAEPQPPASDGEPSEETDPTGELEEEPTPEEEEEGIETIGYRWNFPVVPPQQPPIPGTNPGRFPLIIGNLQLKYRNQAGQEFWSSNYRIREQSGSLIREEKSLKVVGVSYWKRPDWDTIVLTPIKAQERAD